MACSAAKPALTRFSPWPRRTCIRLSTRCRGGPGRDIHAIGGDAGCHRAERRPVLGTLHGGRCLPGSSGGLGVVAGDCLVVLRDLGLIVRLLLSGLARGSCTVSRHTSPDRSSRKADSPGSRDAADRRSSRGADRGESGADTHPTRSSGTSGTVAQSLRHPGAIPPRGGERLLLDGLAVRFCKVG